MKLAEYLTNKFLGNKPDNNQTLLEKIIQIHDKKIDIAKLAKTIIEKESYSEIDNILGQRLFGKAFQANDFDLVQTLHSKGVKLDYKDMLGRTALHFAIKSGAGEEIIQFLVDNITDINTRDKSGSTYLHWAANNHHTLAAKLLVDKGAYSFMPDYLGKTPLKLAECYGDRDMMEILGDHTA
ncbi:MAG: ankyrin repeat domain-containing protein [Rickettsia endosymbiont of Pentastiridius leporinus]